MKEEVLKKVKSNSVFKIRMFLVILFMAAFTFLPVLSFAGDMEIMVDEMVNQGVITREQGDKMLKGMQERKATEQEKAKAEGKVTEAEKKGTEPEWVKNIPDWVKNPPDWVKNIKFSGDLRLRYDYLKRENLSSSSAPDVSRSRGRFRLRLGAETKVLDNVTVGFGLASSENGNPRSNNQTFNSGFSKKSIWIDYAYVAYAPFQWLTISGGKLKTNPIFRANSLGFPASGLIWDPDITPEGLAVVFNYPALLSLGPVSIDVFMNNAYFILDEFSNGREPYMFVAQPGINAKITKDINFKTAVAYYKFWGVKNKPLLANQPSPGNTNTLTAASNYQFNYDSFVASGELGYKTPFQDIIPYAGVFGEFITNLTAHHNDEGWTGGVRFGSPSLTKFGDWQLAYAYRRLERDSWLDTFPDDDFYQGQTNAKGHYLTGSFGLTKNISTGVNYFHTVNISGLKQPEDRLFVDLLLKF